MIGLREDYVKHDDLYPNTCRREASQDASCEVSGFYIFTPCRRPK